MLKNTVIGIILALSCTSLLAEDVQKTKEFADLKCKLTLPSSDFVWLDHKLVPVPNAKAVLRNNSGTVMLFMAFKASAGSSIDRDFMKGIDHGFCQGGQGTKISGDIITFKKVPCYQLQFRITQQNSCGVGVARVFLANGYAYSLQVAGDEALIKDKEKWEKLFSAFEFIGTPNLPGPKILSAREIGYKYGRIMGRIIFYCIVIALIAGVVALARRSVNKKKNNS